MFHSSTAPLLGDSLPIEIAAPVVPAPEFFLVGDARSAISVHAVPFHCSVTFVPGGILPPNTRADVPLAPAKFQTRYFCPSTSIPFVSRS